MRVGVRWLRTWTVGLTRLHWLALAIPLIGIVFSVTLASLGAITIDEGNVLSWIVFATTSMTFQTLRYLRGRRSAKNLRARGLNGEAKHMAGSTQRTAALSFVAKALIALVGIVLYIRLETVRTGTTPLPGNVIEAWVARWAGDILRWALTSAFGILLIVEVVGDRDLRLMFTMRGHDVGVSPPTEREA